MQSIIHYAKDYAGPKANVYANQNTCKNGGGGINRESIFFHLQKKVCIVKAKKSYLRIFCLRMSRMVNRSIDHRLINQSKGTADDMSQIDLYFCRFFFQKSSDATCKMILTQSYLGDIFHTQSLKIPALLFHQLSIDNYYLLCDQMILSSDYQIILWSDDSLIRLSDYSLIRWFFDQMIRLFFDQMICWSENKWPGQMICDWIFSRQFQLIIIWSI